MWMRNLPCDFSSSSSSSSAFDVMASLTRSSLPWVQHTWVSGTHPLQTPGAWFWGTHKWAISAAFLAGGVSRTVGNVLVFGPPLHRNMERRSLRQSSWDGYLVCSGLWRVVRYFRQCQLFLFFSVLINNRGLSHPFSWLREGCISFWSLDMVFTCTKTAPRICLLVGCLTSQQQASVSQGRICSDNCTCCHTEIEVADQTFYLTQSQYTDTGQTSHSADPRTPGAWQGSHWSAKFWVTGMTPPRKNPGARGIRTRDLPLSRRTPSPLGQRGGTRSSTKRNHWV